MKYIKEQLVNHCFHGCPFFKTSGHIMECSHPHFEDSDDAYSGLIITQENSRDRVPDECPLRNHIHGDTEVAVRVSLIQTKQ